MSKAAAQPLPAERKAERMHRQRRVEGQVRALQKRLEEGADCTKIAQQLRATRHALDSTYVRLNLSVAGQERSQPTSAQAQRVTEVLDRLQTRLGRSR
ncbi:MAG: metal-sensing transcriptional repressor [Hydrogenophaga sp.]|uniref:metal-sensing transcriptional repressor n=1 Tax=Hydrogenophaga sp. TaxID=1904254 RepID=UPI0027306C91|nr:metal-sensing transcriptional repressor [Hydrogenophaga sp.]MDP2165990.1 metal-sensing transcriptional repressor [Hydrogenophaga sp.]MDP3477604.1 metal-sensing transcriptional repressor [Hydrogenophaga sp.]